MGAANDETARTFAFLDIWRDLWAYRSSRPDHCCIFPEKKHPLRGRGGLRCAQNGNENIDTRAFAISVDVAGWLQQRRCLTVAARVAVAGAVTHEQVLAVVGAAACRAPLPRPLPVLVRHALAETGKEPTTVPTVTVSFAQNKEALVPVLSGRGDGMAFTRREGECNGRAGDNRLGLVREDWCILSRVESEAATRAGSFHERKKNDGILFFCHMICVCFSLQDPRDSWCRKTAPQDVP